VPNWWENSDDHGRTWPC